MTVMIQAKFTFHPIGHGLFYSGTINGKQVVYDFGKYPNSSLQGDVDLLIVSHFHRDHIADIPKLMSQCSVKRLVIPYLTDFEKKLFVAELKFGNVDVNDEIQTGEGQNPNATETEQLTNQLIRFVENPSSIGVDENQIIRVGSNQVRNEYVDDWIFQFYMPKRNPKYKELEEWAKQRNFSGPFGLQVFNEIKQKMQELGLSNNVSNLVCAHGPANSWIEQSHAHLLVSSNGTKIYSQSICNHEKRPIQFPVVQVLTGDAEFQPKAKYLGNLAFYPRLAKTWLDKVFLFQVPHHGSDYNWRDWFLPTHPNCKIWPVTHNSNGTFNGSGQFPGNKVKSDLLANLGQPTLHSVTEDTATQLDIEIVIM